MLKKIMQSMSIKAGIATAALALAVALGAGAVSYHAVANKLRQILQNKTDSRAMIISTHLGNELRNISDTLEEAAHNTLFANALADSTGRDNYLRPYLNSFRQVGSIPVRVVLSDFRGQLLAANTVESLAEPARSLLQRTVDSGKQQFQVDAVGTDIVITLFCPVLYANTGLPEGSLLYQFSIRALCRNVFTQEQNGNFRFLLTGPEKGQVYSFVQGNPPGENSLFSKSQISISDIFQGWSFYTEVWEDGVWLAHELKRLTFSYIFIGVLGLLIIVPASLMGARRMLARLNALETAARSVMETRSLEQKFPQDGEDEIASLGQVFNRMLDDLNQAYQTLKSDASREMKLQSERFRRVLSATLEGYIRIDMKTRIVEEVNEAFCGMSKSGCEIWEGQPAPAFLEELLKRAESEHRPVAWTEETEIIWEDGHKSALLIHCSLDIDENSNRQMVAFLTDISDLREAENRIQSANRQLVHTVSALEKRDRELTLLNRMNDLLLASRKSEEAFGVLRMTAAKLFPSYSGALAILNQERQVLETVITWGNENIMAPHFHIEDCWGMRQGRLHETAAGEDGLFCSHLTGKTARSSLCIPLAVQGKTLGLLWSEVSGENHKEIEGMRQLLISLGDAIKLAISNLELRDALQEQAIRDPLTGLYNRRHFSEVIVRELARSRRSSLPLSLAIVDLDHFKSLNDNYGHDAGDRVLIELGRLLRENVRISDIAFRFGGEEFVLLLPETDEHGAGECLNGLRTRLEKLHIFHKGQALRTVTMSVGVALFPLHGEDGDALVRAADSALYRAKELGRNNVQIAQITESEKK